MSSGGEVVCALLWDYYTAIQGAAPAVAEGTGAAVGAIAEEAIQPAENLHQHLRVPQLE